MRLTPGRRLTITGATLLLTGALAGDPGSALAQDGSWPQFRGPNRDGRSADTNLLKEWDADGPALAWKTTGLGTGYSSLSVTADRIYTMGDLEGAQHVLALAAADGKLLWKTKIGPVWLDRFPGPRATPTVDGALIYALGTEGDLVCLEGATGKVRWQKNLAKDFGGFSHVRLEVRRVAARGRRSRHRHARLERRRAGRAEQGHRCHHLEGRHPHGGGGGARRGRLLVGRDLERRRREAVRPASRARPGRHPRLRRRLSLGLQPGCQQRRQHPDADRAAATTSSARPATTPGARS